MNTKQKLLYAVDLVLDKAGSQEKLASFLGITQGAISQMLNRGQKIPLRFVKKIERKYGISRYILRPDIYE